MEWIRVKDKLPETSDKVLAYGIPTCNGSCGKEPRVETCSYDKTYDFEFGEYDCGLDATHWMPLPEAPKDDT